MTLEMTLELQQVSAGYGGIDVIHGIDLTVRPGEIVTLVGANGAGKSTLVKTISGLVPVRSGTITFDGRRIETASTAARMRLGIAHVPEGRQIFSGLTVGENLASRCYATGCRRWREISRAASSRCSRSAAA
jgi:branched-chain amino acid transport system ATP-binding protein